MIIFILQIKTSLTISLWTNYGISTFKFFTVEIWESVAVEFNLFPIHTL